MKNVTKLLLALLLVAVVSFANGTDANEVESSADSPPESCWMHALDSAEQEGAYYQDYTDLQFEEAFNWYYGFCQEAGVLTVGDPVFL